MCINFQLYIGEIINLNNVRDGCFALNLCICPEFSDFNLLVGIALNSEPADIDLLEQVSYDHLSGEEIYILEGWSGDGEIGLELVLEYLWIFE